MNKYKIFRDMLDYMASICAVNDADMNWCGDAIRIVGENGDKTITMEITIKEITFKEEKKNA